MTHRYKTSEELLERALRTIPLGSQTFSKSLTQYPRGVSPFFIERGKGARVWDPDGNEYIDFVNGLCAVTLGYGDPDVDEAVTEQLRNGVTFSLPHRLEMEVAERLVEMVPSAEKVRFGKNGSDATSAAVRIARAYTGRDRVAVCGYHGWQDWYIGSTARHLGVPGAVRDLTHTFAFNDLGSLEALFAAHPGEIAAVVMEPMNVTWPAEGFLDGVAEVTRRNGAVLIFDETITGFRYANGGAQTVFGVTPDLTTLGKGIANGYPLSAVVGRADLMDMMEHIFFSGTFGGETLSLAAARAVLDKLRREPVTDRLNAVGRRIQEELQACIRRHDAGAFLSVAGHPTWSFLIVGDAGDQSSWWIKTLYEQEMFARGMLALGTHNVSYAHTDDDIAQLMQAYDEVVGLLAEAVRTGSVRQQLRCAPLEPLFKVR